MNRSRVVSVLIGFCLGLGFVCLIFLVKRPATSSTVKPSQTPVAAAKATSVEPVSTAPAEQATTPPAVEPVPPAPAPAQIEASPPAAKPAPDFQKAITELARGGLGAYRSKGMMELAERVKTAGTNGVRMVIEQYQSSNSPQERFVLAGLLETIGDPSALPALQTTLQNDPDLLVRRMASHAAAVIGTDAAVDVLRPAMVHDEDWGVRVNSAYGLAKQKQPDGLNALQQYYNSADTPAEYRLAILGGLADVADPSTGPMFQEILSQTTDAGYVLISINALEKMKDVQSLPVLQRIVASAKSDMIKQAAQRAIDNINK